MSVDTRKMNVSRKVRAQEFTRKLGRSSRFLILSTPHPPVHIFYYAPAIYNWGGGGGGGGGVKNHPCPYIRTYVPNV